MAQTKGAKSAKAAKKSPPVKAKELEQASPPSSPPRPPAAPRATTLGTKIGSSVGIIAAMILAVMANVLVARHYKRWDWTSRDLYTLSAPTVQTLRSLAEPISVYVLLSSADPLAISVRQLLEAYRAETTRIDVKVIDPDVSPAEFMAVQQRFVIAGKTEDGRIVTDAPVIVTRGDAPYFVSQRDLVDVEAQDESDSEIRTRPRMEQAITAAIRALVSGERPRACFTSGHGERSIDVGGSAGAAALRDRLTKNNYDVVEVPSVKALEPSADRVDLKTCRVLIVAGPTEPVPPEDTARYRAYIEQGGSALIAVSPEPNEAEEGYVKLGVGDLLATAGVKLGEDFVFELDPKRRSAQGFGETFAPVLSPHPITEGLIKASSELGLPVIVTNAHSLEVIPGSKATPVPLLTTSDQAFGMVDFFTWAKNPSPPAPSASDKKGPLTLAYAAELPRPAGSSEPHGPRVVVIGSAGVIVGANWSIDELRGTAVFVESAISWLAARPAMLDIPPKASAMAGLRVSEESIGEVFRYVVIYMPLAAALLGAAVFLRRRGTERRGDDDKKTPKGRGSREGGEA